MVNYKNGKIYKIECNETGEVYYGSTTRQLCNRIAEHRSLYKRWLDGKSHNYNSFIIIGRGNYSYSLVEDYPCERKEQLHAREKWYIKNNDCVNKCIPGRTSKEWHQDNKEKVLEKQKKYYEDNKGKEAERNKKYRENNKEKEAKRKKKYVEQKVRCECCNIEMRKDSWSRHTKTKRHIDNSKT